jgi:hypothetical protein
MVTDSIGVKEKHIFSKLETLIDSIDSFIYPTDAQIDGSKNVKIYINIYVRGAPTCFGFSQPSSGSALYELAKFTVIKTLY